MASHRKGSKSKKLVKTHKAGYDGVNSKYKKRSAQVHKSKSEKNHLNCKKNDSIKKKQGKITITRPGTGGLPPIDE